MGRRYSGRAFCEALISECVHVWLPPTHTQALLCLYVVSTRVFIQCCLLCFSHSFLPHCQNLLVEPSTTSTPYIPASCTFKFTSFFYTNTSSFFFTSQQTLQRYCGFFPAEVTLWGIFIGDCYKNCNKCHYKLFCT